MKKDITGIVDNYLCHSCGSCDAVCGHNSISFHSTSGGYVFPKINYDTCTNCTLCFEVCPGNYFTKNIEYDEDPFVGKVNKIVSAKATCETIYKNSQSGGAVTAILKYLFDFNKISAAVITTMDMKNGFLHSKAKIVYSVTELSISQKSKYVPTSINKLIPDLLKIDGNIAIVGLSCHFEGLENLIKYKKKINNKIIKIGLICDRVLTESSIDFFKDKITKKPIKEFIFRDTTNTNYPGDISITTIDGRLYTMNKTHRILMKNFFTPFRCRLCFDKMNVFADIVVGDPHGVEKIYPHGESLIISRTELGLNIIEDIINYNYIIDREVSYETAINGQGINEKKLSFSAYCMACKELGKKLPQYPIEITNSLKEVNNNQINEAKKDLLLSLKIDSFKDRKELLIYADKYYKKVLLKYQIIRLLSKIKKYLKKG